jgi:hypothetical protein
MTARQGQCAVCKSYYWQIEGRIVAHLPNQPVSSKAAAAEDRCAGSGLPPLGSREYVVGRDDDLRTVSGGLPTLGKRR